MSAVELRKWWDIPPAEMANVELPRPGLVGPLTTEGDPCPWPWEPIQLKGRPIGQYHCSYCGEMVIAGTHHPDYR